MLALEIEYLTGRVVATRHNEYREAEWPPHPSRLFSALVCAWGERRPIPQEIEPELSKSSAEEHAALTWLESLPAPQLRFSGKWERSVVPVYVPANDSTTPRSWRRAPKPEVLPAYRPRQERTFPSVTPESRFVYLLWPEIRDEEVANYRAALERLAANVISVGHSSSLTRVAVCEAPPQATHRPAQLREPAEYVLRVPTRGRLQKLEDAHEGSEHLDDFGQLRRYAPIKRLASTVRGGVFEDIILSSLQGPALPIEAILRFSGTLRAALMKHSQQPPCEILTGHQPDGRPTSRPHISIIPLAFVDSRYADGSTKGVALVLPRAATLLERHQVVRALARVTELVIPGLGLWRLNPIETGQTEMSSLNEWSYVRPSKRWATVTPIILDRFPKKLVSSETEGIVALACERIGLPQPTAVSVCEISAFRGAPPSFAFPTLSLNGKPIYPIRGKSENGTNVQLRPRLRVHAQLEFSEHVRGPIVVGAGRFLGMGLCRVLNGGDADESLRLP